MERPWLSLAKPVRKTYRLQQWLCQDIARQALCIAVRSAKPFTISAFVLLPDHFHCLWTLPPNDSDLSPR